MSETRTKWEPDLPWYVAVTTVDPLASPVRRPEGEMGATVGFELSQDAAFVTSSPPTGENRAFAVIWNVWPSSTAPSSVKVPLKPHMLTWTSRSVTGAGDGAVAEPPHPTSTTLSMKVTKNRALMVTPVDFSYQPLNRETE